MSPEGAAAGASIDIAELCFMARALAQSHPMTEGALCYRQHRFEVERARQPVTEIADWASTALLVGYCLRRAEERITGITPTVEPADLEIGANAAARQLCVGDADSVTLLPAGDAVAALDRIIATELDKRNEHVREQLDDEAWTELEEYVAWWVIHGYGVRAAETGLLQRLS